MKGKFLSVIFFLVFAPLLASAQWSGSSSYYKVYDRAFYGGAGAALSMGCSTFRSITDENFSPDIDVTMVLGYRFSRFFSIEGSFSAGWVTTTAMGCCARTIPVEGDSQHYAYWLSSSGQRYYDCLDGTDGWWYDDLTSRVSFHKAALQTNFNVLSFFRLSRYSRCTFEISPQISALRTVATHSGINSNTGEDLTIRRRRHYHIGYGGQLSLGYNISPDVSLKFYAGITNLTRSHFDYLPKNVHTENFLYDCGLKAVIHLGRWSCYE